MGILESDGGSYTFRLMQRTQIDAERKYYNSPVLRRYWVVLFGNQIESDWMYHPVIWAIDGHLPARYIGGVNYAKLITIEPDKRSGQPCIRGLRMTVQDVLEYLAGGMTPDEILADFPDLTAEDIRACLAFAADRERRLRVVPAA